MAGLTYDHVSKQFEGLTAVQDLVLGVENGELMVLVGPSGCGKSTILRLTAGLERVSAGEIYIGGRRVTSLPARDRDVAMVFQNYALYPHLSVFENLAFGLRVRGTPRRELQSRVGRVAELLDIAGLLERKPAQLSGGQRQRVALGRAIVREPRAFLMDEPLSNLDAQLRVQTRGELIRLHQRLGTTTVYVTHDQVEAMTMGQRIAVLRGGMLQQVDTPGALFTRPANAFVATFIGTPSMNLVPGLLDLDAATTGLFRAEGLTVLLPPIRWQAEVASGQRVLLGVRPDHLVDVREAQGKAFATTRGRVIVVEPLGTHAYVHLQHGTGELIARFSMRSAPRLGDEVEVALIAGRTHLFDAASERAVAHIDLSPASREAP